MAKSKITAVGIEFEQGIVLKKEQVHKLVEKYTRHAATSKWVIGDAILRDERVKDGNVPSHIIKEYAIICGTGTADMRAVVRTCRRYPIAVRQEKVGWTVYRLLCIKEKKLGTQFVEEALKKFIDDGWTAFELRSYVARYERDLKRNRFAVDTSPEAGPEGRVLQEVYSETDNEWILLETLGMYTVKSLKHDNLVVDVSYKVDCEDAKIKAKELADLCLANLNG